MAGIEMDKISYLSASVVAPQPSLLIVLPDPSKQARFASYAYSGKVQSFGFAYRSRFLQCDLELGKIFVLDWKQERPRLNFENLAV